MGTIERWYENEDWDIWVRRADLVSTGTNRYRSLVDFAGPGGATRYYFFARLHHGAPNPIQAVEMDTDVAFEPDSGPADAGGTATGFQWVKLGSIVHRRGYVTMHLVTGGGLSGLDRIYITQNPRYLANGRAERQVARQDDPEPLSGVPLGGVGAGKIELCRDGRFRNITINGNIDTPIYNTDGTFLAVSATCDGASAGRVLATESLAGLVPVASLEFEGRYPFARLHACDPHLPVSVEVEACGTIIPRNLDDSCLPVMLVRVGLQNHADAPATVTVALSMENLLGCGGTSIPGPERKDKGYYERWEERAGNREEPWAHGPGGGALFTCEAKQEKRSEGQYVLATDGPGSAPMLGWRPDEPGTVWTDFADTGRLPEQVGGPSQGDRTAAAVTTTVDLPPGQSDEVRFVFAWYVPHFRQTTDVDYGHYYCRQFDSAADVATYAIEHFDRLCYEADEVPAALAESSLPDWLSASLANDAYVLSTCSWLTRDGRFSINESPQNMFGCMGTLDQKLYGSHYYSLFFPELDMSELAQFARAQAEGGGIQHDLGYGQLDLKGQASGWPDLSSSLVIQTLKLYQLTGDQAFVDEMYPHCVKALLEYQIGMDTDGDGIANISGVGNTFDSEKFEGTSSYIATVWLAALKSLAELARRRGDTETETRARELFDRARTSAIAELWNGTYFANYYDVARKLRNDNSHFSQLAGEFYSLLLGLGACYGPAYAPSAMRAVLAMNFHPDLAFPANEATPEGRPPNRNMWGWLPHARVYLGALPFVLDMPDAGLDALERLDRALAEANDDNRWDQRLFYEPDTGKQHWGTFYMTAPATWYAYQAMLGYLWDRPAGRLGLVPHVPERLLPLDAPLFLPDLWARLVVSDDQSEIALVPLKCFAPSLPVQCLRLPDRGGTLRVTVEGQVVPTERIGTGERYVEYACPFDLAELDELRLTWTRNIVPGVGRTAR